MAVVDGLKVGRSLLHRELSRGRAQEKAETRVRREITDKPHRDERDR